jgi:hypothetical protein
MRFWRWGKLNGRMAAVFEVRRDDMSGAGVDMVVCKFDLRL